ncbi:PP2C family protein-serine/threonine phosphatase [Acidocella sp.]|uniref:PP2C family protein-serine/threonine phosphatase n=1 Tax=Acidocella sp. TaxID=50710 RepID=UPI002F3FB6C7
MYDERSVAYLRIDADLKLSDTGGHLAHYGLTGLCLNEPALEQLYFLEGLVPLAETPLLVPSIELLGGRAADLHLHLDGGTVWVLLVDVTADRDAARRMQQKAYDMTLLEEKEALLNRRLEAAHAALTEAHRELVASRELIRLELERKHAELSEARTLQLALAPPAFQGVVGRCGVSVDVVLEPAKEVGGDLVDYFCIGDGLLVLLLGDVANKGAGAALMMARTHALFRGLMVHPEAPRLFRAPEEATRIVNATLAAGNSGCMFVTLLVATFDGYLNRLVYTRAGHVPPFLRRADGVVERLNEAGGPPLGLVEGAVYRSATVNLGSGDELLIVTDGITEAMDPSLRLFGEARIADAIAHRSEIGLLERLLGKVRAFEAGGAQSDDIAAILLTVAAPPER